jgi:hypothetical protein
MCKKDEIALYLKGYNGGVVVTQSIKINPLF